MHRHRGGLYAGRALACLAVLLLHGSLPAPPAAAQTVFRFSGSAGQVGKALPPPGQSGGAPVSIRGRFLHAGALDLCGASVTLTDALADPDLGELVRGTDTVAVLPLTLENPKCSGNGSSTVYESPNGERPTVRFSLRKRPGNLYDFAIKFTRATIPAVPQACADGELTAPLGTSFVLDDGAHPEVVVATVESWRCTVPTIRANRTSPVPTPTLPPGATPTPTPTPAPTPDPGPSDVPTPSPVPTPERGVEIDFTGKATRLGHPGEPVSSAEIRISGTFCGAPIADLMATSIRYDSVLDETDEAEELLGGVPLLLAPVEPTSEGVAFECQGSSPSCSMEVKQLDPCDLPGPPVGVRYEYQLKVNRSEDDRRVPITYVAQPSCGNGDTTDLTTDFTIVGEWDLRHVRDRVWKCSGSGVITQLTSD